MCFSNSIFMWSCNISFCYVRHFKFNNYQRCNSYYTRCPYCTEYFNFSDALTISQEIEEHTNSRPFLFYRNTLI